MSDQQQPPLRPGDRVRYIHDRGHIEVVESCELATTHHWQVVTTWNGNRRIASAVEFTIEGARGHDAPDRLPA